MEIVLLFAGLVCLGIGGLIVFSEAANRRGAIEVTAELVGFSTGSGKPETGKYFYAVARYPGLDGRTRYLESSVGSSSPLGFVGDRLTVLAHPGSEERASIKSPMTYVLGGVIALIGAVCCVVFCAVFRATPFSLAAAAAVTGWGAWKLRDKPLSLQAFRQYRSKLVGAKLFTEETRADIRWADPALLQGVRRTAERTNRVAIPLLIVIGAGLGVLGAHLHEKTRAFLQTAVRGTGVVVELDASHSSGGVTWAPIVELEHEGRRYRFRDAVSSNPPSHRPGDVVDVLYDPASPADARIDRGRWNQGIPILVGAFGAMLCSLGLWMALHRRREPARTALEGG